MYQMVQVQKEAKNGKSLNKPVTTRVDGFFVITVDINAYRY